MIDSIEQAIVNKIAKLYTTSKIYLDDVPQKFEKPSFLITVTNHDYNKRINTKYNSLISFDVAFYSNKGVSEIKSHCLTVQINLLREFDLIETYRVLNKQANIVDNVLHFTFDIRTSEIKIDTSILMQHHNTNTNI